MAVYIAVHKDEPLYHGQGYIPLQVGASNNAPLPYLRDDTGVHISEKNPHYCELTGLFWVWQNTRDDYKGLVHYRRYFTHRGHILTEEEILRLLTKYDILLPRPEPLRETAWQEFCLHSGFEKDLILTRRGVATVSGEMLPAFDKVMAALPLIVYSLTNSTSAVLFASIIPSVLESMTCFHPSGTFSFTE